jgi:hypothetical protein
MHPDGNPALQDPTPRMTETNRLRIPLAIVVLALAVVVLVGDWLIDLVR